MKTEGKKIRYFLQDICHLINSIIPILSFLSVIVGGVTSFIYLDSLNARNLLSRFGVQEFIIIFFAWFVYMLYFYLFMYSNSISYRLLLNKGKGRAHSKIILKEYCILTSLFFIFIVGLFSDYNPWFVHVILVLVCLMRFFDFRKRLKYVASFSSALFCFSYPIIFLFLAVFLNILLSHNVSISYSIIFFIVFFFFGLLGNVIIMSLGKNSKSSDILGGIIVSIVFFFCTIAIPSYFFNTNIMYSIFAIVGMADRKEKAYFIDVDFLDSSNIRLDNYVHSNGVKYICAKALIISNESYVFDLKNQITKTSNFYQIPIDKVKIYQGELCR